MLELAGVLFMAMSIAFLLLPVWTFTRVRRMSRRLEVIESRLSLLETAAHPRQTKDADAAVLARDTEQPRMSALTSPDGATSGSDGVPALVTTDSPRPVSDPRASTRDHSMGLEERLGGRALLYAGVLTLLLGVSFFLKYAFENQWIGPWGRVLLGLVTGMSLLAAGVALANRGLEVFGRALAGTAVAVLYLSVYAATALYALIGQSEAFALMVLVTVAAAWLADRQGAQSLAFVAVGGGFLTPFLVGGRSDAQVLLFGYTSLLVAGTWLLARRHAWLALNALAYVLTVATLAAWSAEHYRDDRWLTTLLFLSLFCALFLGILRETRRLPGAAARLVAGVLWSAAALYHIAALALTSPHPPAFHVYLIVFTLAGLLLTVPPATLAAPAPTPLPFSSALRSALSSSWLRVFLLLMAVAPLFGYLLLPEGPDWLVANVVTILAVCGLHLFALLERSVRGTSLGTAELLALHLGGVALFGLLHQTLLPIYPGLGGALAIVVGALAALLWLFFRSRDHLAAINALALALTLVAVATALQFDGRPVVVGWAAQGVAVAWIGLRAPNRAFRVGGVLLWAAAALRLTEGYFDTPVGFTAVLNERSLTTIAVVGLGYVAARRYGLSSAHFSWAGETRTALHVVCSLLTLLWISGEIRSYWAVRYETPQAYLYEQLLLSLGWGAYGAAAIVTGLWWRYAPLRYIGMAVIGVTVLKVFFVDLWDLGGIYRVVGFLSIGVLLVLVSYLYQRRQTHTSVREDDVRPA